MADTDKRIFTETTAQAILAQFQAYNNFLAALHGDRTLLTTEDKSSLVAAINELVTKRGALSDLSTTSQANIVSAINEIVNFSLALKEGSGTGLHNSIYRGKYLGSAVTPEQWAAIEAGTFDDLWIGDYWTIGGVNWRIADFDYFLKSGDTECTKHHVMIVPDTALYTARMNASNTTDGGYVGSEMYKTNLAQAKTTINNAFGASHILSHREFLTNAVSGGKPSAGSWYNSTVELMSEQMVYGGKVFAPTSDGSIVPYVYTVAKSQFNLFRLRHDMTIAKGTDRAWWWLRDVVSGACFANVNNNGNANNNNASNSGGGVRPDFTTAQYRASSHARKWERKNCPFGSQPDKCRSRRHWLRPLCLSRDLKN